MLNKALCRSLLAVAVLVHGACGHSKSPDGSTGGNGGKGGSAGAISVAIEPTNPVVTTGGTIMFTAAVSGSSQKGVSWSVEEGAAGGSVTDAGLYTAPAQPGKFQVVATSVADSTKKAVAMVTVTMGPPPAVMITPKMVGVLTDQTQQFTVATTALGDMRVTWSVMEGPAGGTINETGLYTAPTTAGSFHVVAKSRANDSISDTAVVTVSGAASGSPGVWQNVTPPDMDLKASSYNNSNFGTQDVLADPVRRSDVYAFGPRGMWKSTDYGLTWKKTSLPDGPLEKGGPWGEAIDPNPNRNPMVPPTMYANQGYGPDQGIFKSTDGGINWTQTYKDPGGYGRDLYSIDIDPNNSQHLLASFHDSNKLVESLDGGQTWIGRGAIGGASSSTYIFFVTSSVWLMVSGWGGDNYGTWRTEDSGKAWAKVSPNEHFHGNSQIYVSPKMEIYLPGAMGIQRSTDLGKTWMWVSNHHQNSIVGTPNFLYASDGWATQGGWDADLLRAPANNGAMWGSYVMKPAGMTNGAKRAAVTYDGSHYIIVSGNWLAGLWRYVEN